MSDESQTQLRSDRSQHSYPAYISTMVIGIVLLIILIHVGFFNTYIKHFPKFQDADIPGYRPAHFTWVKHFHGMMMMGWVFMLLLQPILIRTGRMNVHRRMGRLSYVLAPLVLLSIFLINKHAYNEVLKNAGESQARAVLALIFPAFVFFGTLYFLAIRYRRTAQLHMRFMASTAFLFIPPALDRMLIINFQLPGYDVGSIIELSIIGAVTIFDSVKTKKVSPFLLVFIFEALHTTFWHLRETPFWQTIAGQIAKLF
ncbi:MAG: hypothetical protein JNK79_04005 [Chitinophagaceae bacterium]|nr:hypothetical protein [Chitinophagaceae bacterium]